MMRKKINRAICSNKGGEKNPARSYPLTHAVFTDNSPSFPSAHHIHIEAKEMTSTQTREECIATLC